MTTRLSAVALCSLSALLAHLPGTLHAQEWPTRPVRMIVPFAPGGSSDLSARLIAPRMQEALGQPVLVENRAGAGGTIATDFVAKSAPDGYTLLLSVAGPYLIAPLTQKTPYDPARDFAPITIVNGNPQVLLAHPSVAAKSIRELIALAKAQPAALNFATAGPGSLVELSALVFNHMAGTKVTVVSYKGGAPAVAATLAGETQLTFANTSDALPQIKSGKLTALAVTSAKRFQPLPEVPAIAESGLPEFDVTTWNGLAAPAGTPAPVVNRIARVVQDALKDPVIRQRMVELGTTPGGESPEQARAYLQAQSAFWAKFIRDAGVR